MKPVSSLFDPSRIARNLARASAGFADHDFLHERVWQDLFDRTASINREFKNVAVLGDLFPAVANDLPAGWTKNPPFRENEQLDMLISFLQLHRIDDLPAALARIRCRLKPDGVVLGALFGGHTLRELRQSLIRAEAEITGGVAARIIPFVDVRTLGALVQAAGFALPVIDVETVMVRYSNLGVLLHDIRAMGEANPMAGPIRPLRRALLHCAEACYREDFGDQEGRLPARFDILHICGWAPDPGQPKPLPPGSGQVFLGDVLKKT